MPGSAAAAAASGAAAAGRAGFRLELDGQFGHVQHYAEHVVRDQLVRLEYGAVVARVSAGQDPGRSAEVYSVSFSFKYLLVVSIHE